jgi:hypothetical protein
MEARRRPRLPVRGDHAAGRGAIKPVLFRPSRAADREGLGLPEDHEVEAGMKHRVKLAILWNAKLTHELVEIDLPRPVGKGRYLPAEVFVLGRPFLSRISTHKSALISSGFERDA